mmetsp:Transcript_41942/g.64220  ORF Transcript_41942/g.64220 Transcript_41942/m.64220 type:complete len:212 (-) Transcript_41942:642-1277(-)|eukprot:CAMPEP_0170481776 /NCGR_PEP_ID=MMETSP0208-20121228/2082_1 /TAXON_ID=197538 /ORGANISM="Strombidium inclinatum, Strain S3" /LENGTH=211 /DNA_ID=CAMNT_0010754539 /DNA_START=1648 /DNA_END=2283 /DNA_ORIENTATION=+
MAELARCHLVLLEHMGVNVSHEALLEVIPYFDKALYCQYGLKASRELAVAVVDEVLLELLNFIPGKNLLEIPEVIGENSSDLDRHHSTLLRPRSSEGLLEVKGVVNLREGSIRKFFNAPLLLAVDHSFENSGDVKDIRRIDLVRELQGQVDEHEPRHGFAHYLFNTWSLQDIAVEVGQGLLLILLSRRRFKQLDAVDGGEEPLELPFHLVP